MSDRSYTNNEVRQNIAMQIEQSKAFALLYQTKYLDKKDNDDFNIFKTHIDAIYKAVQHYLEIPANDNRCSFEFLKRGIQ